MKTASRLTLIVAAALTALLPVAAQAGTRAGDSGAAYGFAAQGTGVASGVDDDDDDDDGAFILWFSAAAAIVGGIFIAMDSGDDGQSPGT